MRGVGFRTVRFSILRKYGLRVQGLGTPEVVCGSVKV
jgi:hypothetical protein